ncbi:MAG: hypothetical protein HYZ14_14115 [Bacteroidetes bacterium]|nr:hypothetical protein [Bacteroidota bacterium]
MRLIFITLFIGSGLYASHAWAQLGFPLEEYYQGEIERRFLNDSADHDFYTQHLSSKPIRQSRTQADSIYADYQKRYYWLTQKIFKENFLIFEGDDFWCAVDPILDLEAGHDFYIDSLHYKYWNTRGIRVQARFLNKVGFVTTFYENQAMVPDYQRDLFNAHGEFQLNGPGTAYKQVNGVVPGYARTKLFKKTGYDFAFAEGYLSIEPNRYFNLQFGNGNHFIGSGYRSLLLSDNATNAPFLKLETNFWNNRIQYQVIYNVMTNLYRLPYYTTPEATYERKLGAFHYLDLAITKNISLGLFEGAVWKHTDSLGTAKIDPLFANPVILSNSLIKGSSANGYNAIAGLNLTIRFFKNILYGQLVLDENKLAAYQAGLKAYDVLFPKLDLQAEYNHADQNTYLSTDKRYNYSHYNLPLAHPLSAGFDELVFKISYQYNRWFFQNHTTYSAHYVNDTLNFGTDILQPSSTIALPFYTRTKTFYNQLEAGYRFNKRYNLQACIGFIYRTDNLPVNESVTQYVYLGIRTRLKNKRFDY